MKIKYTYIGKVKKIELFIEIRIHNFWRDIYYGLRSAKKSLFNFQRCFY